MWSRTNNAVVLFFITVDIPKRSGPPKFICAAGCTDYFWRFAEGRRRKIFFLVAVSPANKCYSTAM